MKNGGENKEVNQKKNLQEKFNSFLQIASEKINEGGNIVKQELDNRGITDYVEEKSKKIQQSDIGKKAIKMSEDVSKGLDQLSGKEILTLVEKRLELQEQYNDVLATKLDEALKRIVTLEAKK